MEKEVARLRQDVDELSYQLRGNGTPGVAENVRGLVTRFNELDASVKAVQATADSLVRKRQSDEAEKRGRDKLMKSIFGLLVFLVGGGGLAMIRLFREIGRLAQ